MIANPQVRHRLSWWCYPILILAVALLPCLPTAESAFEKNAGREVSGVVKSLDSQSGTITVQAKGTGETTFTITKEAKVLLDNGGAPAEGKLSGIPKGTAVKLRVNDDKRVSSIKAEGPTVKGILQAADSVNRTILVEIAQKGSPKASKTYSVAKNAGLSIDDGRKHDKSNAKRQPTLLDLPLNSLVVVRLSVDRKTAVNVHVHGEQLSGVLKAIGDGQESITMVVRKKGEPEVERTYSVAKHVSVSIDDGMTKDKTKPIKARAITEVPLGTRITVRLSVDRKSVIGLRAEAETAFGNLKAVNAAKNEVTLKQKGSAEKTYSVRPGVLILLDGKRGRGKLTDLPVGASVRLKLHTDRKSVLEIHALGQTVFGRVSGKIRDGGVTIDQKGNGGTYPVDRDTPIHIEGRKGSNLADLIDGTIVRLRLSVDKTRVLDIHAEGPSFKGRVKAVDPNGTAITLTIGGKNGVGGDDREFKITKTTGVFLGSFKTPQKLSDIRPGTNVFLRLAIDQKSADRIIVLDE